MTSSTRAASLHQTLSPTRRIGMLQQGIGIRTVVRKDADTDTCRRVKVDVGQLHRALYVREYSASDRFDLLRAWDLVENQHELVAPEPRQRVVLAQNQRQPLRHFLQHRIAR